MRVTCLQFICGYRVSNIENKFEISISLNILKIYYCPKTLFSLINTHREFVDSDYPNLVIVLFLSHRLENIVGQTNVKTDDNEKICARTHYHLFVERYDSIDDDYRELMICLRKHQLVLEFVILSSMIIVIID